METPLSGEFRHRLRKKSYFGTLYGAAVLLVFHWGIVAYINSTFLEQFIPSTTIGLLYTVSAALTILGFLFISRVLRRAGNYKLTMVLAILEFVLLIGLGTTDLLRIAIPLFVVHQLILPLMLFNLDIYMEKMIGDEENSTGSKRGLMLTTTSLAGAIGPLAAGYLVGADEPHFSLAYLGSAFIMLLFIMLIARGFRDFQDSTYDEIEIWSTLREFWVRKDIRNVFFSHVLLQLFFVWTVIYIPLYMATETGFNWNEIGIILFVGLFAYVLFEYPIGIIADRWIGEKEMMALGFVILAVSTAWISFITTASIGVWMLIMFLTRTGASLIEATTESYFFKHTKGTDANIISFFRISRPLSYIFGALIGSLTLLYLPFNMIFLALGIVLVSGLFFTMALRDTK